MQALSFDVTGMTCGGCTGSVQRMLSNLNGISHAEASLSPDVATVVIHPAKVSPTQIESAISHLSYFAKAKLTAHTESSRS